MSRVKAGDAARLLSRLDELSDEEVTSLLVSMLAGEQSGGSPAAAVPASYSAPAAAPGVTTPGASAGVEGRDERRLLERLDELSDEEVAALLGEMLAENERAGASAAEGPAPSRGGADASTVTRDGEAVSVDQMTDEEVTRMLGELLGGKGEAE